MYVKLDTKTGIIIFSNALSKTLRLKPMKHIFLFRLMNTDTFGFMIAGKEQVKSMYCAMVRRSASGYFYINPKEPSLLYMASVMRLYGKNKLKVKEQPLKNTKMYIIQHGTNRSR